jgi:hypothetical protein
MLVGELGVAGAVVQQPEAGVHVRVLGILLERTLELFAGQRVVALLQVGRAELDVVLGSRFLRIVLLERLAAELSVVTHPASPSAAIPASNPIEYLMRAPAIRRFSSPAAR